MKLNVSINGILKEIDIPDFVEEIPVEIQIAELKQKLTDTDYIVIKIAEGAATIEEYKEVIAQRQEWRKEIGKLGG